MRVSAATSSVRTANMGTSPMFICIEDLTLGRCSLEEESQLGEGVVA